MKCEVCLQLLEEYIDGELGEPEAAPLSAHLITCGGCSSALEVLAAEQEIYSRYDRELAIAPTMWNEIATRTVATGRTNESDSRFRFREWFAQWHGRAGSPAGQPRWGARPASVRALAGAMAILLLAVAIGLLYSRTTEPTRSQQAAGGIPEPKAGEILAPKIVENAPLVKPENQLATTNRKSAGKLQKPGETPSPGDPRKTAAGEQSDVLFSDVAFSAIEERDTQQHIEQAQNLLRSVRNIQVGEDDEIDVSFEKAQARRLLNDNVVLRRDAEMNGKFPVKMLLSDLEPFLIDIANLPDKPAPDDLRVLKDRVLRTEIVAALQGY